MNNLKLYPFTVYLNDKIIDTVFFEFKINENYYSAIKEVKESLVNHDGYNPCIKVR